MDNRWRPGRNNSSFAEENQRSSYQPRSRGQRAAECTHNRGDGFRHNLNPSERDYSQRRREWDSGGNIRANWRITTTAIQRPEIRPLYPDLEIRTTPHFDGSRHIALEGCSGDQDIVTFIEYHGNCQPSHVNRRKFIPKLQNNSVPEVFPASRFFTSKFSEQLLKLQTHNSTKEHQEDMRITVRFGQVYICETRRGISLKEMPVWAFNEIVDDVSNSKRAPFIRSFGPSNRPVNVEHFGESLKKRDFIEETLKTEYKVNFLWSNLPGQRQTISLTLDSRFRCIKALYDGMYWFNMDIKRSTETFQDVRFLFESNRCPDSPLLLERLRNLTILCLNRNSELVVPFEYRERVSFVRSKTTRSFSNKNIFSRYDSGVIIEIITVREYALCNQKGKFHMVGEPRTEVAIKVSPSSELVFDTEQMMKFIREFLPFCCELESDFH